MRPFTVLRRIPPEPGALASVELPSTAAGAGSFPAAAFAFEARVSGSEVRGAGVAGILSGICDAARRLKLWGYRR